MSFVFVIQPIPIKPPRKPSDVEPISSSVNGNQQPTSQTPTKPPWTLQMPSHSPTRTPRRSRRTLCSLLEKAPRKTVMPSRPARAHLTTRAELFCPISKISDHFTPNAEPFSTRSPEIDHFTPFAHEFTSPSRWQIFGSIAELIKNGVVDGYWVTFLTGLDF